jgi:protein TonB
MSVSRREQGLDPATGLVLAIVAHIALYFAVDWIDPPEIPDMELVEFEIATMPEEREPPPPPPPKEAPKEPEIPEPQEEQKAEPEVKKEPPKKKQKIEEPKTNEPPPTETNSDPNPKPKRFDLPPSQLVPPGGGGVAVPPGGGGSTSGSSGGAPGGSGNKPGSGGGGTGKEPGPVGTPWAPKGDLYIAQQPRVKSVPEYECPAVSERQVSGTVVLLVQVQKDGKVRSARTSGKKFGYGCDEIARKALLAAKFAPALGTDGKAADYELRYEYVFELRD